MPRKFRNISQYDVDKSPRNKSGIIFSSKRPGEGTRQIAHISSSFDWKPIFFNNNNICIL